MSVPQNKDCPDILQCKIRREYLLFFSEAFPSSERPIYTKEMRHRYLQKPLEIVKRSEERMDEDRLFRGAGPTILNPLGKSGGERS